MANFKNSIDNLEKTPWAEWILPSLLLLLSPLFLFPQKSTVWILFVVPLIFLFLFLKKKITFQRTMLDWKILILSFLVLVSGLVVADVTISLPKVVGFFFGVFVFYSLVPLFKDKRLLKIGIMAFILGGTTLAVFGIMGMSRHDEPKYIRSLFKFLKSLPSIRFGLPGAEEGFHPNAVGGGLALILPLCFVLILPYLVRKNGNFRIFQSRWSALFFFSSFMIMASVLVLTQSRSSFAGMFVVSWLLIFVGLRRKKMAAVFVTIIMLSALIGLFFLAGSNKLPYTDLESRNKLIGRVTTFWEPAIEQIKQHPVFGMGMNHARTIPQVGNKQGHLHNLILHTAAELGIPALIAYMAILFGTAVMCRKVWRTAKDDWMKNSALGLGCGQLALFVFGFLDVIPLGAKVGIFFWISLALISSLSYHSVSINQRF